MSWRSARFRSETRGRLMRGALGLTLLVPAAVGAQSMLPAVQTAQVQPLLVNAQVGEPSAMPPAADLPPLPQPQVQAASAIVVDVVTGQVVWEKNARVRRPMASTTKIMTATLILESGRLDEQVTYSEHARKTPYDNLNATPNEQIPMTDLL